MAEGEGVTPPYMQLAHWRFALKLPEYRNDTSLRDKLMAGIKQGNMAPYYKAVSRPTLLVSVYQKHLFTFLMIVVAIKLKSNVIRVRRT